MGSHYSYIESEYSYFKSDKEKGIEENTKENLICEVTMLFFLLPLQLANFLEIVNTQKKNSINNMDYCWTLIDAWIRYIFHTS